MAALATSAPGPRFDLLICTGPSEVLLLTGYWPIMAATVAIFTRDGDVKIIVPEDELDLAQKTSAAEIFPYQPASLDTLASPLHQLRAPLASALGKISSSARIGVQLAQGMQPAPYIVANDFRCALPDLIRELCPNATLIGCDDLLEKMKAAKTPAELSIMQSAAHVAAAGFASAEKSIAPGKREPEIAAAAQSAFEQSPAAKNLRRSYGAFFCMSGPNSASASAAYARTRQRVLENGDLVMLHANTCADGFWTDITRTYTVGPPTDRQQQIRAAISEARAAGLRAIRPGATGRQIDSATRAIMHSHGFGPAFKHAAGHGVGFAAANPYALPRIHPLSPDVLEEGMTFNLEPAAYFDGYGGMRHCDVIAVTANGAQVLTNF
jgi:Xaa-Pro aminopeptidase